MAIYGGFFRGQRAIGDEPAGFKNFPINRIRPSAEPLGCLGKPTARHTAGKPEVAFVEVNLGAGGKLVQNGNRCERAFEPFVRGADPLHGGVIRSVGRRFFEIHQRAFGIIRSQFRAGTIEQQTNAALLIDQRIENGDLFLTLASLRKILCQQKPRLAVFRCGLCPGAQNFERVLDFVITPEGDLRIRPRHEPRIRRSRLLKSLQGHVKIRNGQPQRDEFLDRAGIVRMDFEPASEQFDFGMRVLCLAGQIELLLNFRSGRSESHGRQGKNHQDSHGRILELPPADTQEDLSGNLSADHENPGRLRCRHRPTIRAIPCMGSRWKKSSTNFWRNTAGPKWDAASGSAASKAIPASSPASHSCGKPPGPAKRSKSGFSRTIGWRFVKISTGDPGRRGFLKIQLPCNLILPKGCITTALRMPGAGVVFSNVAG